ncbi:oxygenase MpaB family protein [Mycobacterium tuberculosis]|uniref:oxygenase MpaB family protein n=1 Tax=Mycobacterium tuberculosis TaxID=1773 RepID=UPI003F7FA243
MPGVGYGVLESRVESGRLDRHPIKRARTTFTYVAVAVAGSDDQKAAFRRAVNKVHAQVYSTPESPVSYHAFDPELQLWVAACLYKGGVDVYRTFVGEMDDEEADHHYRAGMAMGTTLQVPPQMWPPDRAAFDRYWRQSLDRVHIDDVVRDYLYPNRPRRWFRSPRTRRCRRCRTATRRPRRQPRFQESRWRRCRSAGGR